MKAPLRLHLRMLVAAVALSAFWFLGLTPGQATEPGKLVFNVLDYGAKSDATALATQAFQRAIAAAKTAGGGIIFVPLGRYFSGPIELFSNMTLDVDAGATITFPVAPLPLVMGRYLGVNALVPIPLVGGHDVENVGVTGAALSTFPAITSTLATTELRSSPERTPTACA